jgi:hypothetical protein
MEKKFIAGKYRVTIYPYMNVLYKGKIYTKDGLLVCLTGAWDFESQAINDAKNITGFDLIPDVQ